MDSHEVLSFSPHCIQIEHSIYLLLNLEKHLVLQGAHLQYLIHFSPLSHFLPSFLWLLNTGPKFSSKSFSIAFTFGSFTCHGTIIVAKSSRFAGITTYPISAKSYSSILFKHRKKSRPSSNLSRNKRLAFQPSLLSRSFLLFRRSWNKKRKLALIDSYIHRELSSLFINRHIPGPHVLFRMFFSRWRINSCIIIDLSSMIPLISASS